MKKIAIFIIAVATMFYLSLQSLFAADAGAEEVAGSEEVAGAVADSLQRVDIERVVVTGTRNGTDVRHLPLTVSVVGRQSIEQSMQPSLLPLLSEQVPGLFVTQRGIMGCGVSDGAAGGISLRGLSGGAGRLMVLVDGHPQYMGLFGHPIADACQSFMAEKVEVLRGPASTLYGSNAMGGVVNIVTRKMDREGWATDINAGYGSFNTLQSEVSTRMRFKGFTAVASLSYNRTDGHRKDMGFEQYGGYAKAGYEFSQHWSVRADVNVTHFNASNPGPVTAPLIDARQGVTRGMVSAGVSNEYDKTSGGINIFFNWGRHKINDGHTAAKAPKDYLFNSRDRMYGISVFQSVQLFRGNRLTVGADYYSTDGEAWNRYIRDTYKNGELAFAKGDDDMIVDKREEEIAGYVDFRQHLCRWLTLDAGVRADSHSRVKKIEWIPQAGLSLHLPHDAEIKLSAAKGFRYPTLREMYMFPPKNPDLRPESMWSYELSLQQTLIGGRLTYGVNIFYIDGKNMIVTVPNAAGAAPLNLNTGRIENCGIELSASGRIGRWWSADANYSYLHMKYPVIAAPEHKLYAGVSFMRRRWAVATGVQYIDGLYTSVKPDAQESFVLWNARLSFSATRWLSLWVRGDNLLAQRYEINAGYPMPRATVMGGVKFTF